MTSTVLVHILLAATGPGFGSQVLGRGNSESGGGGCSGARRDKPGVKLRGAALSAVEKSLVNSIVGSSDPLGVGGSDVSLDRCVLGCQVRGWHMRPPHGTLASSLFRARQPLLSSAAAGPPFNLCRIIRTM